MRQWVQHASAGMFPAYNSLAQSPQNTVLRGPQAAKSKVKRPAWWGGSQPSCVSSRGRRASHPVGSRKGGPDRSWGTCLQSQFKWPLPVGPLFYVNLDYITFIDNFGPWVYSDTHFLTQEQDDIFHLLKFLLLGRNFQYHSYTSCLLLLSLFPVFFTCFVAIESF